MLVLGKFLPPNLKKTFTQTKQAFVAVAYGTADENTRIYYSNVGFFLLPVGGKAIFLRREMNNLRGLQISSGTPLPLRTWIYFL